MSYLISLREQFPAVAREVFLHDPYFQHIHMIRTNKHARIFLRHVIRIAKNSPSNRNVSSRKLARLFGLSRTSFMQWFRYNARLPIASRRVRWFLNETIRLNAEEDLTPSPVSSDLEVKEKIIELPSAETKAVWKQRMDDIREAHRNLGPTIKTLPDALKILRWMQRGYSSSLSSEHSSRNSSFVADPDEERKVEEDTSALNESRGLIGPPGIIINQQLLNEFDKMLNVSNESDGISKDNEVFHSGLYDLSNQSVRH
jgi:AraC-like DNA-binding protein